MKIFKYVNSNKVKVDEDTRTISFVASTEHRDRDDEVIKQDCWDLKWYRKNPIVLLNHDYYELPIGRSKVKVENKKLLADITFASPEVSSKADTVYKLVKEGYMNSLSVGFIADRDKIVFGRGEKEPRVTYHGQELLEISVVGVPCNPNATALKTLKSSFSKAVTSGIVDELEINELLSVKQYDLVTKIEDESPDVDTFESFMSKLKNQIDREEKDIYESIYKKIMES